MMAQSLPAAEVDALMQSGRVLDAWKIAKETGVPLERWAKGEPLLAAASLARALGATRLSQNLDWINWRHDRKHPKWYFHGLFSRIVRTPGFKLLEEIDSFLATHPEMEASDRANLLAFSARNHASHRDFAPAFACIEQSLEMSPGDAWIHIQHSSVLESADRYEDALKAAQDAVGLRPAYSTAMIQCANILVLLGRDDDAIRLLVAGDEQTQNAAFAQRLQVLYSERDDHEKAMCCLDRIEERSLLMEDHLHKWIAGRRADFHFRANDLKTCLEWCDRKGEGLHLKLAKALRKPGAWDKKRVRLDVPFVRQHRMTCAPATLSAIASYWKMSHDHLAIADAICHEGTPWHREREWAEQHGFIAREFRVTAESLRELIDRGVPFTLTTEEANSAHLQACIGYDERSGTILVRDPTERHFGEMFLSTLIESHPVGGPRGMVMVPKEEAHRLDGIQLADEAAYDSFHGLLLALDSHDRWLIETAAITLRAVAPGHPLAHLGTGMASAWKEDRAAQLAAVDELLRLAPDHSTTLLRKAWVLRCLGRWQDLREFLETQVAKCGTDPVFISELGELLMEDARLLPRSEIHLKKALRLRRYEARCFESYARLKSKQLRHGESKRLRRIASCLSPDVEIYARHYFDACRATGNPTEGITFLAERVKHFGRKSGKVWLTLATCVHEVRSNHEAAEILQQAVAMRPDDGELSLKGGAMMVGWGAEFRAMGQEWMEKSRTSVPETSWLGETAMTSSFLGQRANAIRCWRSLVRIQPLNIDAWRGLARLIAEEEGKEGAIAMLDEATEQYPRSVALWCLKAEWLVNTKRGPLESLDRALQLDPTHLWALRERAIRRQETGDHSAAEADAREALTLNPWLPESHGILGTVLEGAGDKPAAADCMRAAIRLGVDYTFAAIRLVALSRTWDGEVEAITFIEAEMKRQVSDGSIVPVYQKLAWDHLDPPVLLHQLQDFCSERPDLWQTWSACVDHALQMRLDEEALQAAATLTESFPLMPRAWLDLARVHQAAGRHADELKATARAVELSPGWDEAARAHAQVLEILGRPDEAVEVLKRASQLDPLNGPNHGCLAETLRRNNRKAEAFSSLREALNLCPYYTWGWQTAAAWAIEDGCGETIAQDLVKFSEQHGHSRYWWPLAANAWDSLGERAKALDAVEKGLRFEPADADLRDHQSYLLWSSGDFEAALAACAPLKDEPKPPVSLEGRRAWLLMHSGQPLKGVEEMRALLKREPGYTWGMAELAMWHEQRQEWSELRKLCKQWLRYSPDNTRILGYLGKAELALDDKAAAKETFSRAHALDPGYVFASRQLLDLQIIDGDLDSAAGTLAQLEQYSDNPHIICDGIELELKRRDTRAALERASNLIQHPGATPEIFERAAGHFTDRGLSQEWKDWITVRIEAGPVTAPGALVAYLATVHHGNLLRITRKRVALEPPASEARAAAWMFAIQQLGRYPDQNLKTLRKLAKDRTSEVYTDGRIWNVMGETLLGVRAADEAVRWLNGWEQRQNDVTSGTFVNLSAAHDTCRGNEEMHWQEAGKLRKEGLKRFPDTGNSQALRAGHALHLAVNGNIEHAETILADFESGQTWDYYQAIAKCAKAIVAAARNNEETARESLATALGHLCQFNDLGTIRLREKAERAVASHLPWTHGKVRHLRKKWRLPLGIGKAPGFFSTELNVPLWPFCILAFILIRACSEMVS